MLIATAARALLATDSFDALHEGGLFLYDMVQAGGKRLSSTYVTRTLVGKAGVCTC
jgi:FTO catalytic domain